MLNLNVPALIKVRDGITINLALSVSQAVESDVPQWVVKEEVKKLSDAGKLERPLVQDDYVQTGVSNTVTFWFIDQKALTYRVGEEITQDDFDRIAKSIEALQYKLK